MSTEIALPRRPRVNWFEVVADWKASGLPKSAYCHDRGIAPSGLYAALRRQDESRAGFIRARVENASVHVLVELPNGIRVSSSQADIVTVASKLAAIEV